MKASCAFNACTCILNNVVRFKENAYLLWKNGGRLSNSTMIFIKAFHRFSMYCSLIFLMRPVTSYSSICVAFELMILGNNDLCWSLPRWPEGLRSNCTLHWFHCTSCKTPSLSQFNCRYKLVYHDVLVAWDMRKLKTWIYSLLLKGSMRE